MPAHRLRAFATDALLAIHAELSNATSQLREDLNPCGYASIDLLLSATASHNIRPDPGSFNRLLSDAYIHMKENRNNHQRSLAWRRLYTEVALIWSLSDCCLTEPKDDAFWENCIARLDKAIIFSGAPGEAKLELITVCIALIQDAYLPCPKSFTNTHNAMGVNETPNSLLSSAALSVPSLDRVPSIMTFSSSARHTPFVLRGFADDWPAISEGRWIAKDYLKQVAGRGRVVPIEVGHDYRASDWTQRITDWSSFLDYLFPSSSSSSLQNDIMDSHKKEVMYHAQHDLFKQFSALRDDIIIPDYVYASPPAPDHYVNYLPPANEDGYVVNAWLGPAGTVSPAHTDPYYNFYVQAVGRKTIWLAPPHISAAMLPYDTNACSDKRTELTDSATDGKDAPADTACTDTNASALGNTSRIDVFAEPVTCIDRSDGASPSRIQEDFEEHVRPVAMTATLGPGDALFFPPGWWHAMRSESMSFSVSFWF